MPELLRAIGYVRVSTIHQVEGGHSLDEQRAKIEAYCDLHGDRLDLIGIEADEGASGKTLAREGLQRVFDRIEAGEVEVVVIPKLDRLTRSVRDLGELLEGHFHEEGAALASVAEHIDTTTAAGRLMLNLLTVVAQWEREAISERITTAMQHMKAQGKRVGHVPYGHRLAADGEHLEEDPDEQRILALIGELREQGLSLRAVAAELNDRQITNRGRTWSHTTVRSKLKHLHGDT